MWQATRRNRRAGEDVKRAPPTANLVPTGSAANVYTECRSRVAGSFRIATTSFSTRACSPPFYGADIARDEEIRWESSLLDPGIRSIGKVGPPVG